jgi:hypothetical protein
MIFDGPVHARTGRIRVMGLKWAWWRLAARSPRETHKLGWEWAGIGRTGLFPTCSETGANNRALPKRPPV